MNNTIIEQLYSLIIYLLTGIVMGVLFDIFRIFRRTFKTNDFITYIEDFIFWILTGILIIYVLFTFSKGELRIYNFVGLSIGTVLYLILFSKKFISINVAIITFIKKIISKVIKILLYPLKLIWNLLINIFDPFTFFVINIKKHIKNKIKRRNLKVYVEKYK